MAKRVRIFFINCPKLDVDAASFLILSQNTVQTTIQFETHHFWVYDRILRGPLEGRWNRFLSLGEDSFHRHSRWRERRFRTKLDLRAAPLFSKPISPKREILEPIIRNAIRDYDSWLKNSVYRTFDFHETDPAIIVTETPIAGKFISYALPGVAILSAAHWRDFMGSRAGSGLEYVLTGVQRLSLRLCYGAVIGSHYSTRGCLWDYNNHQPDVRFSSFLGYLCEACRQGLKKVATPEEFESISKLIKNDWIGEESKPASIAGILKKDFKYSLRRSTGLRPGVISTVADSMKSEFGKFFVEIIKWALIILVTLFFLTFFPDITERWRNLLNGKPSSGTASRADVNTKK
jgi:hypothetical protein